MPVASPSLPGGHPCGPAAEEQVVEGNPAPSSTWRPGLAASAATRDHDGQVVVVVPVAVRDGPAVEDQGVVEHAAAVGVAGGVELAQKVGELLHVEAVDPPDLLQVLGPPLVVREVVVSLVDADLVEAAIVSLVGEQEGGDAGGVALEGEGQEIAHQPDVRAEVLGDCLGRRPAGAGQAVLFGPLDLALHLPHTAQVLLELAPIGAAQTDLSARAPPPGRNPGGCGAGAGAAGRSAAGSRADRRRTAARTPGGGRPRPARAGSPRPRRGCVRRRSCSRSRKSRSAATWCRTAPARAAA